jgi:hypothetical protein
MTGSDQVQKEHSSNLANLLLVKHLKLCKTPLNLLRDLPPTPAVTTQAEGGFVSPTWQKA